MAEDKKPESQIRWEERMKDKKDREPIVEPDVIEYEKEKTDVEFQSRFEEMQMEIERLISYTFNDKFSTKEKIIEEVKQ